MTLKYYENNFQDVWDRNKRNSREDKVKLLKEVQRFIDTFGKQHVEDS